MGRGHERQVVQRKRPAGSGWLDECQAIHAALEEMTQKEPVVGPVASVAIGQGGRVVRLQMGARGEPEPVVMQALAGLRPDVPFLGNDASQLVSMPTGV